MSERAEAELRVLNPLLAEHDAAAVADAPGESIIFPPHPFLGPVGDIVAGSNLALGAQSCFFQDSGAYTGAVSASMVKSLGVTYVLAGHSERRTLFKDDDAIFDRMNAWTFCAVSDGQTRPVPMAQTGS